jgi:hypothetical protein
VVGRIVDHRGARPVETFGGCVMALGFFLLSGVHSLPALYACLAGPVALGSTCIGALPNNTACSIDSTSAGSRRCASVCRRPACSCCG